MSTERTAVDATERPGHTPTLIASFLHFDVSFMLWVLIGATGIFIADDLHLNAMRQGVLVATPILSGSLARIPVGLASDRYGAKRVGTAMLAFLFVPLVIAWGWGTSFGVLLGAGFMLGIAGASFAVALPLASRWYPPRRQGLVMGIAAAGNSGTVVANLLSPKLAAHFGWHAVFGFASIPLCITLLAFVVLAKDPPGAAESRGAAAYLDVVRSTDLWVYCLLYSVTFGGFVGLSGFLPLFFRNQYGVAPSTAGLLVASAAIVGSGVRPLGGWLADRIGGAALLSALLVGITAAYAAASTLPPLAVMTIVILAGMACLGMGNGAVFQLVPTRLGDRIGIATGIVGAVGGLGGFVLPLLLGLAKQRTGSFAQGFAVLGGLAAVMLVVLRLHTSMSSTAVIEDTSDATGVRAEGVA